MNLHTPVLARVPQVRFSACCRGALNPFLCTGPTPNYLPPSLVYLTGYGPSLNQLAPTLYPQSCPIRSLAIMGLASTILFTNLLLATTALARPSLEHRLAQRGGDAHVSHSFQPVGGPKAFDNRADSSDYWSGAVLSVRAIFPMA